MTVLRSRLDPASDEAVANAERMTALVEVHTDWEPHPDPGSAAWGDTVGVFRSRGMGWKQRLGLRLARLGMAMQGSAA